MSKVADSIARDMGEEEGEEGGWCGDMETRYCGRVAEVFLGKNIRKRVAAGDNKA